MKTLPHVWLYPNIDKKTNSRKPASIKIDFRNTNILLMELDKRHQIKQVDLAGGNLCQPAVSKILNGDSSTLSVEALLVFGKQYDMSGGITKSVDVDVFSKVSQAYLNNNPRHFADELEKIKYKDLIDVIDKLRYHVYDMVLLNSKHNYQRVIEGEAPIGQLIAQGQYIRMELMFYHQLAIAYLSLAMDAEFTQIMGQILNVLRRYKERQELHDELHLMYALLGYEALQQKLVAYGRHKELAVLSQKMKIWQESQSFYNGVVKAFVVLDYRLKNK